jgi:hypothetical protein
VLRVDGRCHKRWPSIRSGDGDSPVDNRPMRFPDCSPDEIECVRVIWTGRKIA